MQALSHFSYHNSNGEYLLCDLQGRADADFYTLADAALPCSSATTARPWRLVSYLPDHSFDSLPMHYKLDPKVIDASSVPSFDSLPIHHKIHPQLIDAYIASTKCVARLQRASVRGRFPNVHVFEIHRLVARWLSYSPAPTSTPSRTLWCSRGVACLAQRMRPRLRPTTRRRHHSELYTSSFDSWRTPT